MSVSGGVVSGCVQLGFRVNTYRSCTLFRTERVSVCPILLTTSIESLMDKFWLIEEPEAALDDFITEGQCEVIFQKECVCFSSGRFIVLLTFQQPVCDEDFPGSRAVAQKRFESLE